MVLSRAGEFLCDFPVGLKTHHRWTWNRRGRCGESMNGGFPGCCATSISNVVLEWNIFLWASKLRRTCSLSLTGSDTSLLWQKRNVGEWRASSPDFVQTIKKFFWAFLFSISWERHRQTCQRDKNIYKKKNIYNGDGERGRASTCNDRV